MISARQWPAFQSEFFDAAELTGVVGHQGEVVVQCCRRDEQIVPPDKLAIGCKSMTQRTRNSGGFGGEGNDFEKRQESLNDGQTFVWLSISMGTCMKFKDCDAGNGNRIRDFVQSVRKVIVARFHGVDANVRVNQIRDHESKSRSCGGGCGGRPKSSSNLGPLKNSTQLPATATGTINRFSPCLTTLTFFTCSGNAKALGMRTAWVRLVLKTVDWVMINVYTNGVYVARFCKNLPHRRALLAKC